MSNPLLVTGASTSLVANTTYGLPAMTVMLHSTLPLLLSVDGVTFVLVTATTTGVNVCAVACQTSATNAVVVIKRL